MTTRGDAEPHRMPWELELQALTLARAIHEEGTLTRAALSLGISQPAASQQLRRVEAALGLALVTKAGRGVRLTEAGQLLASRARIVHTELADAFERVDDLAHGVTGRVRIAAFPSASSAIVPELLAAMRARHPGIDVAFVEEEPPEAAGMLADGAVDLAITFSYADAGDPHRRSVRGLDVRDLFSEPTYVVLPADHRLAAADTVDLADLAGDDWIAGCPRCRGHLLAVCDSAGFAPHILRETDNVPAVLGMVRAGLGVAILPSISVRGIGVPDGVRLLPTDPPSPRTVHVVTAPGARRIPAVAAALAALDDVVARVVQAPEPSAPPPA